MGVFLFCVWCYFFELKKPVTLWRIACLPTCAIDSVRGISFGHTCTQFCEFPQFPMPPGFVISSRRSALSVAPVGCALKYRTCEIAAAPTKSLSIVNCGHASTQQPQVMHLDMS